MKRTWQVSSMVDVFGVFVSHLSMCEGNGWSTQGELGFAEELILVAKELARFGAVMC